MRLIVTPELFTALNHDGEEFTMHITRDQYKQLIEAGLPILSFGFDRAIWAQPMFSFPHLVSNMIFEHFVRTDGSPPHWLMTGYQEALWVLRNRPTVVFSMAAQLAQ